MYQIKKRMRLLDIFESCRQNIFFANFPFNRNHDGILLRIEEKKNSCKLSSNIITNGMTTMQYVS